MQGMADGYVIIHMADIGEQILGELVPDARVEHLNGGHVAGFIGRKHLQHPFDGARQGLRLLASVKASPHDETLARQVSL
jgi:hypothetical protein